MRLRSAGRAGQGGVRFKAFAHYYPGRHWQHRAMPRSCGVEPRTHRVSVFSRGRQHSDLAAEVELLTGDRNGDLNSLENRDWDKVLDLASYGPMRIRTLAQALKSRVGHYTFITTAAGYDSPIVNANGTCEEDKLVAYSGTEDPYSITGFREVNEYRAPKVLCEREAEKQFPGKTLLTRPGFIVGPGAMATNVRVLTASASVRASSHRILWIHA